MPDFKSHVKLEKSEDSEVVCQKLIVLEREAIKTPKEKQSHLTDFG